MAVFGIDARTVVIVFLKPIQISGRKNSREIKEEMKRKNGNLINAAGKSL